MSEHNHAFTFVPVGSITAQPNAVRRCSCGLDLLDGYHDLEKQLAEKDKEIERMRAVVEKAKIMRDIFAVARVPEVEFNTWSALDDAIIEYEQSTKPDGGTET